ncbi:hypothetical protein [Streptoalloteichus hindustanus]|uniref:Uncharacterized protein n=1 Tax=Streptoalloteichus hindustanus TaxID=2017 RepID=A0A1M5G9P7_STRHI|nr:hypothetical protein [Streptoalloteichus hindustanus]SHG00436.1 hypothetical protein SAMN05444320_10629 [Streptoalloteichus hindustanus]
MRTWLALPVLFVAAVLGLVSVPMLVLDHAVELYGAVFGAAVAIGFATSDEIAWRAEWQRNWLRWLYLAGLGAVGVSLDGVTLPAPVVAVVGLPSAAVLTVLVRRLQRTSCVRPYRL